MSTREQFLHEDLREGDLLAFLDGEAGPAAARHIATCARCQGELRGLRAADALLSVALARADCPAPELLLRYQASLLPAEGGRTVAAHLAGCADCAAELALITNPPEPSALGSAARASVRLLRAVLQPAPPPALVLRGAEQGRRAVYAVEGYQVLLATTPGRSTAALAQLEGQIFAQAPAAIGSAELRAGESVVATAEVDELGFFAFDAVAPGSYALTLDLGEAQLQIEALSVP